MGSIKKKKKIIIYPPEPKYRTRDPYGAQAVSHESFWSEDFIKHLEHLENLLEYNTEKDNKRKYKPNRGF